jgi:hypothetical protein
VQERVGGSLRTSRPGSISRASKHLDLARVAIALVTADSASYAPKCRADNSSAESRQLSSSIGDGVAIDAYLATEDLGVPDSAFDALHK